MMAQKQVTPKVPLDSPGKQARGQTKAATKRVSQQYKSSAITQIAKAWCCDSATSSVH